MLEFGGNARVCCSFEGLVLSRATTPGALTCLRSLTRNSIIASRTLPPHPPPPTHNISTGLPHELNGANTGTRTLSPKSCKHAYAPTHARNALTLVHVLGRQRICVRFLFGAAPSPPPLSNVSDHFSRICFSRCRTATPIAPVASGAQQVQSLFFLPPATTITVDLDYTPPLFFPSTSILHLLQSNYI